MEYKAKVLGLWALIITIGLFISMIIAADWQEANRPKPTPSVSSGQR